MRMKIELVNQMDAVNLGIWNPVAETSSNEYIHFDVSI